MTDPTIPAPRLQPDHWDHPRPGVLHVGAPGDGEAGAHDTDYDEEN